MMKTQGIQFTGLKRRDIQPGQPIIDRLTGNFFIPEESLETAKRDPGSDNGPSTDFYKLKGRLDSRPEKRKKILLIFPYNQPEGESKISRYTKATFLRRLENWLFNGKFSPETTCRKDSSFQARMKNIFRLEKRPPQPVKSRGE